MSITLVSTNTFLSINYEKIVKNFYLSLVTCHHNKQRQFQILELIQKNKKSYIFETDYYEYCLTYTLFENQQEPV